MKLNGAPRVRKPGEEYPEPPECPAAGLKAFASRPLTILGSYRREFLGADLLAGLTVAAVAIPQAIAYASIAELPPHYGLYTAAIAAIVGALWGCSRFLATGPVNAVSLLVLPILLGVAVPGTPEYLLAASLIAVIAGLSAASSWLAAALRRAGHPGLPVGADRLHRGRRDSHRRRPAAAPARADLSRDAGAAPHDRRDRWNGWARRTRSAWYSAWARWSLLHPAEPPGAPVPGGALSRIVAAAVASWSCSVWIERGVRVVGEIPRSLPPPTWVATGMFPDLHMIRGVVAGRDGRGRAGPDRGGGRLADPGPAQRRPAQHQPGVLRPGPGQHRCRPVLGLPLLRFLHPLRAGLQQSGARTHLTGVFTGVDRPARACWSSRPGPAGFRAAAIAGVLLVVAWRMVDREGIRRVLRTSGRRPPSWSSHSARPSSCPSTSPCWPAWSSRWPSSSIRSSLPRVVPVVPDPTFRHFVDDPERPVCPQLGVLNIRGPLFFGAVHHIEEELRHNRDQASRAEPAGPAHARRGHLRPERHRDAGIDGQGLPATGRGRLPRPAAGTRSCR